MSRLARQIWHIGLFLIVPAASAAAPLAVIPAVTSRFGAEGWSSVAVALAVGVAASVVAELGWSIVGPQRIARNPASRGSIYEAALASRLVAVLVAGPVAAVLGFVLVDDHRVSAALLALGVVLGALSPSWFFTGLGRPLLILVCETAPRILAALLSALIIVSGGPLPVYGLGMIVAAVACWLLAARFGRLPLWPSTVAFRAVPATLRDQAVLVGGRGVTTVYKSLPVVLVGFVSPGAVATFAALDRPLRMGLQVLTAIPNRLQAWIGTPDRHLSARRGRISILINVGLGIVSGAVFAVAMPTVATVLFTGTIAVDATISLLGGILIAVICASRGLGLSLVAASRANHTSAAALVSAAVALGGVPLGVTLGGVAGAVVGLIAAEAAGALVQIPFLLQSTPARTSTRVEGAR